MSIINSDILAHLKQVVAQCDDVFEDARKQVMHSRRLITRATMRLDRPAQPQLTGHRNFRTGPPAESRSVLLFESDDDTSEMYAAGLTVAGFEPLVVAELSAARRHIDRELPTAVVLGASKLDGDQWELVRDLKADERTRNIPVIVVTSRMEDSFAGTACDRGCTSVLLKPCLPDTLATVIRSAVSGTLDDGARAPLRGD